MPNFYDYLKLLMFGALVIFAAETARADAPVDVTVKLGVPDVGPMCSGTIIAPDTVLSAAHCVAHVTHVRGNDGGLYKIEGGKLGDGVDGVVFWVPGVRGYAPIATRPAAAGDEVRAIGFPAGQFSDTVGVVDRVEDVPLEAMETPEYAKQRDIMNSAEIAPGSSGGGLWRKDGDEWVLVGVTVHGWGCFYEGCTAYGAISVEDVLP
jgi:S1-C subfamily serine protease